MGLCILRNFSNLQVLSGLNEVITISEIIVWIGNTDEVVILSGVMLLFTLNIKVSSLSFILI